jgi:hypothetical protein
MHKLKMRTKYLIKQPNKDHLSRRYNPPPPTSNDFFGEQKKKKKKLQPLGVAAIHLRPQSGFFLFLFSFFSLTSPITSSTASPSHHRKTHLTCQKTHKTQPKKPISNAQNSFLMSQKSFLMLQKSFFD